MEKKNMKDILPSLEVNGVTYEIDKTRYILAEYNKMGEEADLTEEDKVATVEFQSLIKDVKKYGEKLKELEAKYFETFDEEDERKYFKMKELYDRASKAVAMLQVSSDAFDRLQRKSIDNLERIAIKAIAEQHFNMDIAKATELWTSFVDYKGKGYVTEWLLSMSDCLFNDEEERESDPFLSKVRAKSNNKKFVK
jgi:hypothetical protein